MVSDEILPKALYLNIGLYIYIAQLCVCVCVCECVAFLILSPVEDPPSAPRFKVSDLPRGVTATDIENCFYSVSEHITDVTVTLLGGGKASALIHGILGKATLLP